MAKDKKFFKSNIELLGRLNRRWLKKYLDLANGIPSHDTFARVMSLVDPLEFEKAFFEWAQSWKKLNEGGMLMIDGKSVRGTSRHFHKMPLHLVNIFSQENGLAMGQLKAISPGYGETASAKQALDLLKIKNLLITVDAGLANHGMADKIISNGGAYLFPIKRSQKYSWKKLDKIFNNIGEQESDFLQQDEKGHGRTECRKIQITHSQKLLDIFMIDKAGEELWPEVKSIAKITRTRTRKNNGVYTQVKSESGNLEYKSIEDEKFKTTEHTTYYICSQKLSAKRFMERVRSHWDIENKLHHPLDVCLKEDSMRVRERVIAENMSLMRKVALNCIKQDPDKKCSLRLKFKKAAWDPDYLESLIFGI
ncbi:MAG: ISAs1 family transposase [Pseudomonadota bacterium]